MRSISRLVLIFSMLFLLSSQAQANEDITANVYFNRAGMKILSGVAKVDIATFWLPTFPTPSPIFVWDNFSKESDYYAFGMGR